MIIDLPEERTTFRIALDDVTVARLMEFADMCHAPPVSVIAAIVHDFLEDAERAQMAEAAITQ